MRSIGLMGVVVTGAAVAELRQRVRRMAEMHNQHHANGGIRDATSALRSPPRDCGATDLNGEQITEMQKMNRR